MRIDNVIALLLVCLGLAWGGATAEAEYYQVWRAGIDNGNQTEFAQENGNSNSPPGSATLRDDDWYFAGVYPTPIGTLTSDSALNIFERALTSNDQTDRIHFNLAPEEASQGTLLELEVDVVSTTLPTSGIIPFDVLFNGINVGSYTVTGSTGLFTTVPFTAASVGATTGENIVTLQRTSADGGWMQFDRIDLNAQVPEPSTLVGLVSMGLMGLLLVRRKLRK